MANNRMAFVCNVCLPEGEDYDFERWGGATFYIAKRYFGAWYNSGRAEYAEDLNDYFEAHKHEELDVQGVENPVRLDYESFRPIPTHPPNINQREDRT